MEAYFSTQCLKDFKNTKKFWQFYSSYIKIRSDKSSNLQHEPEILEFEDKKTTNKEEFGQFYNLFFSNIKSNSLSSDISKATNNIFKYQ